MRIDVPIPHNHDEADIAGILAGAVDVGGGLVRFHHLPNPAHRYWKALGSIEGSQGLHSTANLRILHSKRLAIQTKLLDDG